MISVIIPIRRDGSAEITLRSMAQQTLQDFEVIVCRDLEGRGAPWARNQGMALARGDRLLFCDDDIRWCADGLERLAATLDAHPAAAYSYGAYDRGDRICSNQEFDARLLRQTNFVSTMALVQREAHPGWDESLLRLQDWSVYLTMLERGHVGVYTGLVLFDTPPRPDGITWGGGISWEDAARAVKQKHKL